MSKLKAALITAAFVLFCLICVFIICMIPPEPLITWAVRGGVVVIITVLVECLYDVLHGEDHGN